MGIGAHSEDIVSIQALKSTCDLRPAERRFLLAMQQLGHGRFESLTIRGGELILEPWPTTIRSVKFGSPSPNRPMSASAEFGLKSQIAEFFEHVRAVDAGLIRVLEVRGGLPFCMDLAEADHG
jgi:hypothetical protein